MRRLFTLGLFVFIISGSISSWAATVFYRSVGPNNTGALATGSGGTQLTISGSNASFTTDQSDIIGVGDIIQYDTDASGGVDALAVIIARVNARNYTVQNITSTGNPTPVSSSITWDIFRAYTSLANAESGTENTGIDSGLRPFPLDTGNRDLVGNNEVWNFACYADTGNPDTTWVLWTGWTTAAGNYIRIYTPYLTSEVGISQRHMGKWTDSSSPRNAYRLEIANHTVFETNAQSIRLEGLQLRNNGVNGTDQRGFYLHFQPNGTGSDVRISNCIIRGAGNVGQTVHYGIGISSCGDTSPIMLIWNNLVYDFGGTNNRGMHLYDSDYSFYVYNNTVMNCGDGIVQTSGTAVLKNNLVQNCSGISYSGSFSSSSDYNLSDKPDAPGSHPKNSTTVSFVDGANDDFHLAVNDQGAKNSGLDLSTDSVLPFSYDLDSQSRLDQWDMGADENQGDIYRSVGPNNTSALATGGGNALAIAGGQAFFASALPNNIGVGDVLQYDATNAGSVNTLAFIVRRNSAQNYDVRTASGDEPPDTVVSDQDWSIYRAYTSLANVVSLSENSGLASGLRDFDTSSSRDLVTNNTQWNIACYADNEDTTPVVWDGWTTDTGHYIRIYTPVLSSEVGVSQRHPGVWSDTAYRMVMQNVWMFHLQDDNMRLEGLQFQLTDENGDDRVLDIHDGFSGPVDIRISDCIFQGVTNSIHDYVLAISSWWSPSGTLRIWNNIIYNFTGHVNDGGIEVSSGVGGGMTAYIYNNTFVNCYYGILHSNNTVIVKNNIAQQCIDGYVGTYDAASEYNLSDISGDAPGSNPRTGNVNFEDSANHNYHLAAGDTAAKERGNDLNNDAFLPFSNDVDLETRSAPWDIGADEDFRPTPTPTATRTFTPTPTFTRTPINTRTDTPTLTTTRTITLTPTITPTFTPTPTLTPSPTNTSSSTPPRAAANLDQLVVYPNPFCEDRSAKKVITFGRLPRVVTIRIYSLSGNLIQVIEKDSDTNLATWDLKNRKGGQVSSGVYIFVIKSGPQTVKGKLALIR